MWAQVLYFLLLRNFALLTFAAGTKNRVAAIISAQAARHAAQLLAALRVGQGRITFKFPDQFDLKDPIRRMPKRPEFVTVMDTSTFVTGDGTTFFRPPPQSKDTPTDTTTARWITNIREKSPPIRPSGLSSLNPLPVKIRKSQQPSCHHLLVQPLFLSKHRQRFCALGAARRQVSTRGGQSIC
jgi:hypothetical protein